MSYNLGNLPQIEKDKINVDIAASGVAYKERLNMPVVAVHVEQELPEALREYFRERLQHYRQVSSTLPKSSDPAYLQMAELNKK